MDVKAVEFSVRLQIARTINIRVLTSPFANIFRQIPNFAQPYFTVLPECRLLTCAKN